MNPAFLPPSLVPIPIIQQNAQIRAGFCGIDVLNDISRMELAVVKSKLFLGVDGGRDTMPGPISPRLRRAELTGIDVDRPRHLQNITWTR